MNAIDFSILKPVVITVVMLVPPPVVADQPPPESFTRRGELILTLSNDALAAVDGQYGDQDQRHQVLDQSARNNHGKRPVNLGCGMDVSPFGNDGNSLSNRLVGECNLQYRY